MKGNENERIGRCERRISRKSKLLIGTLAMTAAAAAVTKDNWHIVYGFAHDALYDDGSVALPDVTLDCPPDAPVTLPPAASPSPTVGSPPTTEVLETQPPVTLWPEASVTVPATTIPSAPEVTVSLSDESFKAHDSGVYENDWKNIGDFVRMPLQVAEYFDNKVASYESAASGRIYDFYIYGESEYEVELHPESIEALEQAAFINPGAYDAELGDTIDCMRQILFEEQRFAGTKTAVVIPAGPAYMQNGIIQFGPGEKGKSGFTMPKLKGPLGHLLPEPYSDFMILTTGPRHSKTRPVIRNSLVAHEIGHRKIELLFESSYRLRPQAEERAAHLLEQGTLLNPELYTIEPLATYYRPG